MNLKNLVRSILGKPKLERYIVSPVSGPTFSYPAWTSRLKPQWRLLLWPKKRLGYTWCLLSLRALCNRISLHHRTPNPEHDGIKMLTAWITSFGSDKLNSGSLFWFHCPMMAQSCSLLVGLLLSIWMFKYWNWTRIIRNSREINARSGDKAKQIRSRDQRTLEMEHHVCIYFSAFRLGSSKSPPLKRRRQELRAIVLKWVGRRRSKEEEPNLHTLMCGFGIIG